MAYISTNGTRDHEGAALKCKDAATLFWGCCRQAQDCKNRPRRLEPKKKQHQTLCIGSGFRVFSAFGLKVWGSGGDRGQKEAAPGPLNRIRNKIQEAHSTSQTIEQNPRGPGDRACGKPILKSRMPDRLMAEKMELERKREAILRTLKMRRQAAAAKAAKDATELDKIRLQRAVEAAKTRQLEQAERAARAASAKMRQAAIAKQQAIHAEQIAQARQRELDYMGAVNRARYEHAARLDNAADAAADMQYQQVRFD